MPAHSDFPPHFTGHLLEKIGGNSATIVLDSSGICIFASNAVDQVLNLQTDELLGQNFISIVPLHTLDGQLPREGSHPIGKALDHVGFVQTTPFFGRLGPEESLPTLAVRTIQIVNNGKIDFVIVQIRQAKREVEVGEMKSLFLSFAAHQLKTPSSVVKGFLELMMRQGEAAYSADQWHYITSAFESNEQLIEVSKSLLNMARLEGGLIEPSIKEFDPERALQSKIASFAPLYQAKRVSVNLSGSQEGDEPLNLLSDETFFLEIFGIILGNAIKHSPIGSEITVLCTLTHSQCEVHVIDNGPGIAEEIRKKLFQQAQEASKDENSHGLGLYMAKKYIALLNGSIGINEVVSNTSDEPKGSDFYFIVPNQVG